MSKEKIKDWFNEFFEFSTKDRSTVTSVSCKLFGEHVFNKQQERIAELEKQLKPRLFWDASTTEVSHDSIEELMHIKFEDGAKVGDEIEIQRAVLLKNETYVITNIDDDDYSCEYKLKGGDL